LNLYKSIVDNCSNDDEDTKTNHSPSSPEPVLTNGLSNNEHLTNNSNKLIKPSFVSPEEFAQLSNGHLSNEVKETKSINFKICVKPNDAIAVAKPSDSFVKENHCPELNEECNGFSPKIVRTVGTSLKSAKLESTGRGKWLKTVMNTKSLNPPPVQRSISDYNLPAFPTPRLLNLKKERQEKVVKISTNKKTKELYQDAISETDSQHSCETPERFFAADKREQLVPVSDEKSSNSAAFQSSFVRPPPLSSFEEESQTKTKPFIGSYGRPPPLASPSDKNLKSVDSQ